MPTGHAASTKHTTKPLKIPQTSVIVVSKEFEPSDGGTVTPNQPKVLDVPATPRSVPTFDKLAPGQLCGTGSAAAAAAKAKETPSSTRPKRVSQVAALEACEGGKAHTVNVSRPMVISLHAITNWQGGCVPNRLRSEKTRGTICLSLPCFTRDTCAQIIADAERVAKTLGGWRNRAVGCCTQDVLISQLSTAVQQRVHSAFESNVMPIVVDAFPSAKLTAQSLPASPSRFFVIKYTAEKHSHFGLHIDHTEVTVNVALSDDFEGGGTFLRASTQRATTDAARSSQGLCLRPAAGMCLVHDGELAHAGNAVTRGERYVLVAFFNGGEGPQAVTKAATKPASNSPLPVPCLAVQDRPLPQMEFAVPRPLPRLSFPTDAIVVRGPLTRTTQDGADFVTRWMMSCTGRKGVSEPQLPSEPEERAPLQASMLPQIGIVGRVFSTAGAAGEA